MSTRRLFTAGAALAAFAILAALVLSLLNVSIKVYPHVGHSVHWEQPEQFVADLVDFIA
jgi:pimeloyl-ACP methyl ester carboxylesterase